MSYLIYIVSATPCKSTTGYFTKEADSEEMDNTDEGMKDDERYIPQMDMRNFVKAIYERCVPKELDNLLKSSARFRINSIKNQFSIIANGITQNPANPSVIFNG
jgi:hypothetical protein